MATRNVIYYGDDTLRKRAKEVTRFDAKLALLLEDMTETLAIYNGAGLAAPQVGILRRVAIVDIGEGIIELINPVLIAAEGESEGMEGCLSFPEKYGLVKRPDKVTVKAQDRNGEFFEVEGEGFLARALCHEVDHLDGKLFIDLATEFLNPEAAFQNEESELR